MKKSVYKVMVEHINFNLFTIVDVEATSQAEAERKAKEHFQWVTGTPIERSKVGYVWPPSLESLQSFG